jgi:hypothetical protein
MNIFDDRSPYYAASEAFPLDRREFRELLAGICENSTAVHRPPGPNDQTFGLDHYGIYTELNECLNSKLRLCCADIIFDELLIPFDDMLFEWMVVRPGAPEHHLLAGCETDDVPTNYYRKGQVVRILKSKYTYLGQMGVVWEDIMRLCAAGLVVRWSRRFT